MTEEALTVAFTSQELNMAIDSLSRNYSRLRDFKDKQKGLAPAEIERISMDMEALRVFHLRLVKLKRTV